MDSTYIVTAGEIAACICMLFDFLIFLFTVLILLMSADRNPDKVVLTLKSCLKATGQDKDYVTLRKDFGKFLIPCVCLILLNLLVLDWLVVLAAR